MVKRFAVYLCFALGTVTFAYGDCLAYVPWGGLYAWNLDHPERAPATVAVLGGLAIDILLAPDGRHLIVPSEKSEEGSHATIPFVTVVDVCSTPGIFQFRPDGIEHFFKVAGLSSDGKLLYMMGSGMNGNCRFEHTDFSCFVIDIQTGKVVRSFCTNQMWIGPSGRLYYIPLPDSDPGGSRYYLMSRDARGGDERGELSDPPAIDHGGLQDAFSLSGRLWMVFDDHHGEDEEAFTVYTLEGQDSLNAVFRRCGRFVLCEEGKITYVRHNAGAPMTVDCRHPESDMPVKPFVPGSVPPGCELDDSFKGGGMLSPDGKRRFYFLDKGGRTAIILYIYNIDSNTWSCKYTAPFDGETPGPIILAEPCGLPEGK